LLGEELGFSLGEELGVSLGLALLKVGISEGRADGVRLGTSDGGLLSFVQKHLQYLNLQPKYLLHFIVSPVGQSGHGVHGHTSRNSVIRVQSGLLLYGQSSCGNVGH